MEGEGREKEKKIEWWKEGKRETKEEKERKKEKALGRTDGNAVCPGVIQFITALVMATNC